MKTLRISDDAHQKLTGMLGEITAQTMKMQTYTDAIENMLSQSVTLPPELLNETQTFIDTNKQLGYTTREEFIRGSVTLQTTFPQKPNRNHRNLKRRIRKNSTSHIGYGYTFSKRRRLR